MIPTLGNIVTTPEKGLEKTLRAMNALELITLNKHPEFITWVKETFSSDCPGCYPGMVWIWVKTNFKFKEDAPFEEVIRAPHVMLLQRVGDCDDYSLFIKTCLDVLGSWRTRYILFSKSPGKYSHVGVFAERKTNGFTDAVVIDGLQKDFNKIHPAYKEYKLI